MKTQGLDWKNTVIWIVSLVLAVIFLNAGGTKLFGPETVNRWGYSPEFMNFIGMLQMGAGVMLLLPSLRFFGAAALSVISGGALILQIMTGLEETIIPPAIILIAALFLVWESKWFFLRYFSWEDKGDFLRYFSDKARHNHK